MRKPRDGTRVSRPNFAHICMPLCSPEPIPRQFRRPSCLSLKESTCIVGLFLKKRTGARSEATPRTCRHTGEGGDAPRQEERIFRWLESHWSLRMDKAPPRTSPLERAPKSHACVVLINPTYKVIYVKLPKTGGSSIVDSMGGRCTGTPPTRPNVRSRLLVAATRGSACQSCLCKAVGRLDMSAPVFRCAM